MKEIKIVLPDGIEPEDVVISFKKAKKPKGTVEIKIIDVKYIPVPTPYPWILPYPSDPFKFVYEEPYQTTYINEAIFPKVTW